MSKESKKLDEKLDKIFAKLVKLRANNYCEAAGYHHKDSEGLDCLRPQ
jgi:hypothetical protein